MIENRINQNDLNRLLEFLPLFDDPQCQFVRDWQDYYPVYTDDVERFFQLINLPVWSDRNHNCDLAKKMLQDPSLIRAASLDQIKTMLTYCLRGESFSAGHWNSVLQTGQIVMLLKRLRAMGNLITIQPN